jgi:biopolymer transport protein ExbB
VAETSLWDLIKEGGWLMWPIILCSVVSLAIIIERFWALRPSVVIPRHLVSQVWSWVKHHQMDAHKLKEIKKGSPLGRVLAAGLVNSKHGREMMKESIEEVASYEVHELERYMSVLGSIAAISPLLGLLGTVLGMIKVFTAIVLQGTGNAAVLAGGISEALITTAAGLSVAIPSLFFHRFLSRRIEEISVFMEQEAIKLVDVIHGEREADVREVSR